VLGRLEKTQVRKIIFLCAGNICRSPLAAKLAERQLPGVAIESAGFDERNGRSSPDKMTRIAGSFGLDLSGHRSNQVTREQLLGADLILAMDLDNVRCLKNNFPEAMPHATLLGLFAKAASLTISDPYLSDGEETRRVSEQIQSAITGVADYLAHCKGVSYGSEMSSAAPGVQP